MRKGRQRGADIGAVGTDSPQCPRSRIIGCRLITVCLIVGFTWVAATAQGPCAQPLLR